MYINQKTGLLNSAEIVLSPHFNERPVDQAIDLIVIHGISLPPAQYGNDFVKQLFLGKLNPNHHPYFQEIKHLKVSSHLFITRTGNVVQFVPFHLRAWHAGESQFQGKAQCNDFSVGIELEGTDTDPYEAIQYQILAECVLALQTVYPAITRKRIVGHSDVAPGRKTDPGPAFDWAKFDCLLTEAWHNVETTENTRTQEVRQ